MIKLKISNIDSEFKKLRKQLEDTIQKESITTVKKLEEELVSATPIDTGLARASWNTVKTKEGFDITNSVPYIERLNEGSSKQAPERFIENVALKYGKPLGTIVKVIDSNKSQ